MPASWLERVTNGWMCAPWENGDELDKDAREQQVNESWRQYNQQAADVHAENDARAAQADHGFAEPGEYNQGPFALGDSSASNSYPPPPCMEPLPEPERPREGPIYRGTQDPPSPDGVTRGPRAKAKFHGGPAGTGVISPDEDGEGEGEKKDGYHIEWPEPELEEEGE